MTRVGDMAPKTACVEIASRGLAVVIPPLVVRVRSPLQAFAEQFHGLYSACAVVDAEDYADVDVRMLPVSGLRRLLRPQVQFVVDGVTPFEPFPRDNAMPLFEWGLNWVFSRRMNEHLLLHCSVAARDGRAILFPAWPGSGKSTLAASLAFRGWRYLSDEFGVVDLRSADVLPFVRPAALKNESIEVMRAFAPDAHIGPVFPGTRKGDVAHLRVPTANFVDTSPARVAAVVFPDFQRDQPATLQSIARATSFLKLAGNSFNYEVVGERGFRAVASIMHRCESFILRYGDLDEARAILDQLLPSEVRQ